ncbi:hypothetical protein UFOVP594_32 [uncultured Caudovirales phage]|uniref:Uncharacterized protein n=1 Tax=uncultured Caudovirales phage TaxID=2100421 RepID=A0A6J5MY31_9CAUD|nr:hypothetical protein UFOVP594_32 [uncultured Caudovirales phage]
MFDAMADVKARKKLEQALLTDVLPLLREQLVREVGAQKVQDRIDDNLKRIAEATQINYAVLKSITINERVLAQMLENSKQGIQKKEDNANFLKVITAMFTELIRFLGDMFAKTFRVQLPAEHYLTPQTTVLVDPKTNKFIDLAALLGAKNRTGGQGAGGGGFNGVLQGHAAIGTGILSVTAGTPLQLPPLPSSRVLIQANPNNSGDIVVGEGSVVAEIANRNGIGLFASQSQDFNIKNLSLLWVDGTVTGDKFSYYYEK